jgi:putative FmdB family regulatory protein
MPTYTYHCSSCDTDTDAIVSYEDRETSQMCPECKGSADYTFSPTRAIWGALDYHDESLGVDIHGRRHRQQVMKAMNVREAGDAVGGSRNFEKSHATGILPPNGTELSEIQRKQERAREAQENKTIATINKDGSERVYRRGDLNKKKPVLKSITE